MQPSILDEREKPAGKAPGDLKRILHAAETIRGHNLLMNRLVELKIAYRFLQHEPEGRTAEASVIRGHHLSESAKSLVVEVHMSSRSRTYVLAVVPGDRRVDLRAVAARFGGHRAGLASPQVAERLTGCAMGAVIPFSFDPQLHLLADTSLLDVEQLVFNAGLLDASVFLATRDYVAAANPEFVSIVQ